MFEFKTGALIAYIAEVSQAAEAMRHAPGDPMVGMELHWQCRDFMPQCRLADCPKF